VSLHPNSSFLVSVSKFISQTSGREKRGSDYERRRRKRIKEKLFFFLFPPRFFSPCQKKEI